VAEPSLLFFFFFFSIFYFKVFNNFFFFFKFSYFQFFFLLIFKAFYFQFFNFFFNAYDIYQHFRVDTWTIVSFWTEIWMEVQFPYFSITQVASVIKIEAQKTKIKK
jgi:hypothetical protein